MLPASPPRRSTALALVLARADALGAAALSAAIPTAGTNERQPLIEGLLALDPEKGLAAVVKHLHELPTTIQGHARAHAALLDGPIREAITSRQPASVANGIELLVELRLTRLAYLLPEAVRHGPGETREQAAVGLYSLAKARHTLASDEQARLCSAVEPTIVAYERHPHPALLDAFLELLTCAMPDAWSALGQTDHPAVRPLRERLDACKTGPTRAAVLPLLAVPTLTHACAAALRHCIEHGQLADVLTHPWALSQPAVQHALHRLEPADPYLPTDEAVAKLPDAARVVLPDYFAALRLPAGRLTQALAPLLEDAVLAVRLAALRVWALVDRSEPVVLQRLLEGLGRLAQDREPALARLALRTLESWGEPAVRAVAGKLLHSPHEVVREAVNRRLGVVAFEKLWQRWLALDPEHRVLTARAVRKIDPAFDQRLQQKLAGKTDDRRKAVGVVQALQLAPRWADAVLALAQDPDPHVAATVAHLLGQIDRPEAHEALAQLMHHADARVRANAIEGLSNHQSHRHTAELLVLADKDQPRPRANAIRALLELRTGEAVAALQRMLHDRRPEHRLSALWLIEAVGMSDLAEQVKQLALHDDNRKVADRADDVAYALLHALLHDHPQTPGFTEPGLQPHAA